MIDQRGYNAVIDYMYDFSAVPGSIDGTLTMRYVVNNGANNINSLAGTGDLKNVQIKSTVGEGGIDPDTMITTITHAGNVIGWPDIDPNPLPP